jgi:uncharacterized protein (UPF0335 family)
MSTTVNSDSVAQDQLRAFVERIENLDAEIRSLNGDKSGVYKEAGGNGFDVKVLRKVIADRRKDSADRLEFETIYDLYAAALGMLPDDGPSRVHARGTDFPKPETHTAEDLDRESAAVENASLQIDGQANAGGDHESVTDARLAQDYLEIDKTAKGELAPLASSSDVEIVAPIHEIAGGQTPFATEVAAPLGDESAALNSEPEAPKPLPVVPDTVTIGTTVTQEQRPAEAKTLEQEPWSHGSGGVLGEKRPTSPPQFPNPSQGDATDPDKPAGAIASSAPILTFPAARSLRPNCINPNNCAGHGKNECWSCEQAANGDGRAA